MKRLLFSCLFFISPLTFANTAQNTLDKADNSFMMICTALVLFMSVPGIALFYGGLLRSKNVLSMLTQVLVTFSLISVLWVIYGYSLTFSDGGWFFGSFDHLFLSGIDKTDLEESISKFIWITFQGSFACITCCLILGSFAERIKFSAVILFMAIWFTFSYVPMAHMVWGGGILDDEGALDFAGGTVVHINAAVAGLALINTFIAPAAAVLSWSLFESIFHKKVSCFGACSGVIAGLVGITPAAGFVGVGGALVIGFACGLSGIFGITVLKRWLKIDDTCDVFGVHGICGIVGCLLTGIFTSTSLGGVGYDDGVTMWTQFGVQALSIVTCIAWTAIVSIIAYKLIDKLVGLRISQDEEREGIDINTHGESAFN